MTTGYNSRIQGLIARHKRFFSSTNGGLLVHVIPTKTTHGDMPSLARLDWTDPMSCRRYAEGWFRYHREWWKARESLDDDFVPCLQNLAGTGSISACYVKDPEVHQEAETNYLEPPVKDWNKGQERLGFDPGNMYFGGQMEMLKYYLEQWNGQFVLSPFTHFDPLDLCNQLRGNDVFYDFCDHPEQLGTLLDNAVTWILDLELYVRERVMKGYPMEGAALGGTWVPGNYLSCDIGDMCNPATLAQWGVPYTQRIVEAWGGAFLHHHELGIHQIPTWAGCRGLTVQLLNRDPNTRHLADIIDDNIIRESFRVPINFLATYGEFMERAPAWSEGRFVVLVMCDDLSQGHDVARLAHSLSS